MVKPLDVGQIVPTVEGAFLRLRSGQGAATAPDLPAANAPHIGAPLEALADPVPLAVGALMHRHSLTRTAARERLQRMAREAGLAEAAQAERLLSAIEELARSG
jgi:response regulator NasT